MERYERPNDQTRINHQSERKETQVTKRRGAPNKGNVSDNKVEKFKP